MRFAQLLVQVMASAALFAWVNGSFADDQPPIRGVLLPPITSLPPEAPATPEAASPLVTVTPIEPTPVRWGSVESLFWRVKSAPVVPLVTSNANPNTIASLADPGTVVLFGGPGNPINFGGLTGVRGTVGGWLVDTTVGVEGTVFGLPRQGRVFNVAAAGADGPVIGVPLNSTVPFNGNPAGETTLNPGNTSSLLRVNATTQLWGAEAFGLVNLYRGGWAYANFLAGFNYLDLEEGLSLDQVFFDTLNPGTLTVRDRFFARNQFFGSAIGLRSGVSYGCLGIDLTGKLAVGPSLQKWTATGTTTATGTAFGLPPGETPGGTFAQPSNSGTFWRNQFIVVPQGQARFTIDVFSNVRLWAAYDFIYMSSVIRASTQLDRNINPTQNTAFLTPNGLAAPLPGFIRTDFWAQGVSAGVQINF